LASALYGVSVDNWEAGRLRVKVGSVAFLTAAGSGYGIGLDDGGRRIEFIGDWRALAELGARMADEVVYIDLEGWQVIALNDEVRLDLGREAMAERAAFLRSALAKREADGGPA
jgi:hypothetical protein